MNLNPKFLFEKKTLPYIQNISPHLQKHDLLKTPITSNMTRVYSFEVELSAGIGGLRTRSKVMVNQTRAVDKVWLIKRLGYVPDDIMAEINNALKLHYDLE